MNSSIPDVSRETYAKLEAYYDLLVKWTPKINLISKSSISDLWDRHIWDSAQLYPLAQSASHWLDIGSGGGLPGLIVAIMAQENNPETSVTMLESDVRKATFLRTVVRELDLKAQVVVSRIEAAAPMEADVLSARALADLPTLLAFADRHLKSGGQALFFKGETWKKEVEDARRSWSFDLVPHTSVTNSNAAILEVREIQRV